MFTVSIRRESRGGCRRLEKLPDAARANRLPMAAMVAVLSLTVLAGDARAQAPTGQDIAEKAYRRDDGTNRVVRIQMILVDKQGKERKRELGMWSRDRGEQTDTFMEFKTPADIEGTRFLTLEHPTEDDAQYLLLPAVGRARRIVGGQKEQSFVGTDFTYDDMHRRQPAEDRHQLLREEKYESWNCYVLEAIPVKPDVSPYSRRIVWIDKASFTPVCADLFDRRGERIKQFRVTKLDRIAGIWTPMETVMENTIRKTRTILRSLEVQYNGDIPDNLFTVRHLEEK